MRIGEKLLTIISLDELFQLIDFLLDSQLGKNVVVLDPIQEL